MINTILIIFSFILGAVLAIIITIAAGKSKVDKALKDVQEISKETKRSIDAQKSFIASMSHEIRTPINSVIGLNELNLRKELPEDVAKNCSGIQSASTILLGVINDILDFSKIESGKMSIVEDEYESIDILGDTVGMNVAKIKEKDLDYILDIDPKIPKRLYGDALRIKQVLINVITNAIKYTKEGKITFRLRAEAIDEENVNMIMHISDTGIGIKPESIKHLFDAYSRFDENQNKYIEGTGLGLSITKQLVELMKGEISVDSVYGKGTTFTIMIPQRVVDFSPIGEAASALKKRNEIRSKYEQKFEAEDASVLVVDDNELNRFTVKKLLESTKINIDLASSGKEAINLCKNKKYHVILMDHLMPKMDGIEALNRIRAMVDYPNVNTPVVALTANAGSDMEKMYLDNGFQGYIVKPINSVALESLLLKLLPTDLTTIYDTDVSDDEDYDTDITIKKRILVTTDSFCDLPEDIVYEYGIHLIPCYVNSSSGRFVDGIEIVSENLLEFIEENEIIKSQPPTKEDYATFFSDEIQHANSIIHISITSKESEGYRNAVAASLGYTNVHVIDSKYLSAGQGLLTLGVASMVKRGESIETILEEIPNLISRIHFSFVIKDTKSLYRGGRIGRLSNMICNIYNIHPMLCIKDGDIVVNKLYFGSVESTYNSYLNDIIWNIWNSYPEVIIMTYVGIKEKERERIKEFIQSYISTTVIIEQAASSAIALNSGEGTLCFSYLTR